MTARTWVAGGPAVLEAEEWVEGRAFKAYLGGKGVKRGKGGGGGGRG